MNRLVREFMTSEVLALAPDTSLESAARLLLSKRVTGAPVVASDGAVVGVVSMTDLVDPDRGGESGERGFSHYYEISGGYAQEWGDPSTPTTGVVSDVMTTSVLSIEEDAEITDAGRRMLAVGVHRLLVTDAQRQLAGILSMVDVVRGLVAPASGEARDSRDDSIPTH
jgi:CBS domain-containing protein